MTHFQELSIEAKQVRSLSDLSIERRWVNGISKCQSNQITMVYKLTILFQQFQQPFEENMADKRSFFFDFYESKCLRFYLTSLLTPYLSSSYSLLSQC